MTDQKITDLTAATSMASSDVLYGVVGGVDRQVSRSVLEQSLNVPQVFNVKAPEYGVVGDGVTDDTAAIQACIDAYRAAIDSAVYTLGQASILLFPPGVYLITDSLDLTSIKSPTWSVFGYGAVIVAKCTGKPAIDMLGSRYFRFKGLTIFGDATSTPTFGIQCGRIDSTATGDATFEDLHMNGNFSVACLYNYAGETTDYRHLRLFNSDTTAGAVCLVMDARNEQNITSAFVTQTNPQGTAESFNDQLFLNCDFRHTTGTGGAIDLIGNFNHFHFLNCYGAASSDQLVRIFKSNLIRTLELDIHAETTGLDETLLIDNTDVGANVLISNFSIKDHSPHADVAVIDTTGGTHTVVLDGFRAEIGELVNTVPLIGSATVDASKMQVSGEIYWESDKSFDLSNFYFCGQLFTEQATTVTHGVGSYQVMRRPSTTDARTMEIKGRLRVRGNPDSATANNYLQLTGGTTGNPEIAAEGTSADIDIPFTPKGAGLMRFGTHTAIGAETVTGYVEIRDAGGTLRKIAVVS